MKLDCVCLDQSAIFGSNCHEFVKTITKKYENFGSRLYKRDSNKKAFSVMQHFSKTPDLATQSNV
jgi:hypothetical protein